MADRNAGYLCGRIFDILADNDLHHLTEQMWTLQKDYDFSPYQMYANESLIKLGLAIECECGYILYLNWYDCDECGTEAPKEILKVESE